MVAGIALTTAGAWGLPLGAAQAAAKPSPLVGHRIAGYHPLSSFAASPRHVSGPRKAVAGSARPPGQLRPVRFTARERAESAAMAQARRTGRPVVVAAETTPTVEVVAHPGGTLQEISNVLPVRAMVHGVWQAIDPRLRRTAGGAWGPTVASVPVAFSGGGAGPLVTVANSAGRTVSLYWPAALPRPLISGSVALYRNVLPGVDLRMEATGTGYQEALIVRSAVAAANPRLRSVSYLVKAGSGLVLRKGPGSSLGVIDARTGKLVFVVGRPLMWDSSRTQHFSIPATADAAGSGRITQVPVAYRLARPAAATIVMAPPAAALTGPRVRYPVYIDPEIVPGTAYYVQVLVVTSNRYTQVWNSTTGTTSQSGGRTEIGDCGYSNCVWDTPSGPKVGYVDRDYFMFSTPNLLQRNGQAATIVQRALATLCSDCHCLRQLLRVRELSTAPPTELEAELSSLKAAVSPFAPVAVASAHRFPCAPDRTSTAPAASGSGPLIGWLPNTAFAAWVVAATGYRCGSSLSVGPDPDAPGNDIPAEIGVASDGPRRNVSIKPAFSTRPMRSNEPCTAALWPDLVLTRRPR